LGGLGWVIVVNFGDISISTDVFRRTEEQKFAACNLTASGCLTPRTRCAPAWTIHTGPPRSDSASLPLAFVPVQVLRQNEIT